MSKNSYERGVSYLHECMYGGTVEIQGLERSLLMHSLLLYHKNNFWESEDASYFYRAESCENLEQFIRAVCVLAETEQERSLFIQDDGGWSMEPGGASDCGATLLALGLLLDASGIAFQEEARAGVEYLRGLCCEGGSLGRFRLPEGCGSGGLGGRLEFLAFLGLLYRDGLLKSQSEESEVRALGESLRHELGAVGEGSSCYEVGLCVRGMSLLGLQEGREELLEWLVSQQREDGSWRDPAYGSDLTVTCVVLDALTGALAQGIRLGKGTEDGPRLTTEQCPNKNLKVSVEQRNDVVASVTVYDRNGCVVDAFTRDRSMTPLWLWYGSYASGTYRMAVRYWHCPGTVLCGEDELFLEVPSWGTLRSVSIRADGVPRWVQVGESIRLCPKADLSGNSNGVFEGSALCRLENTDGVRLCDFGHRSFRCDSLEWHTSLEFDSQEMRFLSAGTYILHLEVTMGSECRSERVVIIASSGVGVSVENHLSPPGLSDGSDVGQVCFRLFSSGADSDAVACSIGGCEPQELTVDVDGRDNMLMISGIRDQHGELIRRGILVLRATTGLMIGGMPLQDKGDSCCWKGYRIQDGSCMFSFRPCILTRNSVTSLIAYGGVKVGNEVMCLSRIGWVQIRLRPTHALLELLKEEIEF